MNPIKCDVQIITDVIGHHELVSTYRADDTLCGKDSLVLARHNFGEGRRLHAYAFAVLAVTYILLANLTRSMLLTVTGVVSAG